ncbi:hypothetical protein N7486_004014 [Penicillium sp. IBT 16267x]|nr:hypothetical protein N7486_004014 [Penicillium sp. IBT 16267x]
MLSGTLSARSYLQLGEIAPAETSHGSGTPQSLGSAPGTPLERDGKSGPHLRPKQRLPVSEKTQMGPDRPVRKRGRPRLEAAKDAVAIEERRMQIRRAQRTYRQKKETTIHTLRTRVEVLEQTLQNVANLLNTPDNNTPGTGSIAHDEVRTKQLILAEINKTRSSSDGTSLDRKQYITQSPDTLRDIFGYHVSHTQDQAFESNPRRRSRSRSRSIPGGPQPLLNHLFPTTTIYTYTHQEAKLSRRIHRFCLEHTCRWLTDPHSDPALMTRVFGLLPCIHDLPGVCRYLRRVLQSEIGSPLESSKLPFYTLGGAGTHFPRAGSPENVRRPGKVLRRFARILRRGGIRDWDEDWSGDAEPDDRDAKSVVERAMSKEEQLRSLDLEGDWFDCYDVQGYLEHRGVVLDGSSVSLEVPAAMVGDLYGISPNGSASQIYGSVSENSPGDMSSWHYLSQSTYVLDVECFFDLLLANLRFLGRAPGFRRWDVDAALRTAVHRRSFS